MVDASWAPVYLDDFNTFDNTRWTKANNHIHGTGNDEEPQVYVSSNVAIFSDPLTGDGRLLLRAIRHLTICYKWRLSE